jgi:hypothetical protein
MNIHTQWEGFLHYETISLSIAMKLSKFPGSIGMYEPLSSTYKIGRRDLRVVFRAIE